MALYKIEWKSSAVRELRKLEKTIIAKILTEVEQLAHNPHPPGRKKLRSSQASYRLQVGDFRIVYKIIPAILTIEIIRVGHRREVY